MESAIAQRPATEAATGSAHARGPVPRRRAQARPEAGGALQGRTRPVDLEDLHRGRRDRAQALARADRARDREGRQGRDPLQHPARVDLLRLRGALGRGDGGPDLPDQLARGVPVRARELRRGRGRRRGRRAAREDPPGPRPLPEARARDPDDRDLAGHDLARGPLRARRQRGRGRVGAALALGRPRRHLHLHLHLGHDRPAQGVRDLARQLPRDAGHGPRRQRARRRRGHLPVPAPRALVRAADPARHLRPRRDARLLGARPAQDPPQPGRGQADLLPLGAADLREDLHGGDLQRREGGRAEEGGLRLGDRGRQEGAPARARGQARRARCWPCSTGSPTARCCRRSAACSAAT